MISKLFIAFAMLNKWIYNTETHTLPRGFTELYHDDRVGLVKFDRQSCVVVHRGTDSIRDLFHDFESQIYQTCSGEFLDIFEDSFKETTNIDHIIKEEKCKYLYYTGHSLGGITALISARLSKLDIPIKNIITYGEPRGCCNTKIQNLNVLRIINHDDPIAALPLSNGEINHCTSSTLKLIDENGMWIEDSNYPTSAKINNLELHHIDSYITSISKLKKILDNKYIINK